MYAHMTASHAGAPTVLVTDDTYTAHEPLLGTARYVGGSLIVIAYRTPPWMPTGAGPVIYRTHDDSPYWSQVWSLPQALHDFITTQPAGTKGVVSSRRVEVTDPSIAVPGGTIVIARGPGFDSWVGY